MFRGLSVVMVFAVLGSALAGGHGKVDKEMKATCRFKEGEVKGMSKKFKFCEFFVTIARKFLYTNAF
jgi:hypothetical protein